VVYLNTKCFLGANILGNADGHFHIGNPHLAHQRRSATQFDKIGIHEMAVSTKEYYAFSHHQLVNLYNKFVMLQCSESFIYIMHIAILVQSLLVHQTNKALDKLCTPYLNRAMGFVPAEHGFDCNDERVRDLTFYKTIPTKIVNVNRIGQEFQVWVSAVHDQLSALMY
jgi:hypothetical protein